MKYTLILINLIAINFLTGCLISSSGVSEETLNDCLPAAIAAQKIMEKNGVKARVLIVQWKERGRDRGHAYTVFYYGKAYAYDKNYGSIPLALGVDWRDPGIVAMDANTRRGHFGAITKAEFIEIK